MTQNHPCRPGDRKAEVRCDGGEGADLEHEEQPDINELQEGDELTVQLECEVVDLMENRDDLVRVDADSLKFEVRTSEIVDVDQRLQPVDITEVDDAE